MTDTATQPTNGAANLPAIPVEPAMLPDAERAGRIMEAVIAAGDLAELTGQQRARYYVALCQSLGLNPMTQPFTYLKIQGKTILYANKGCTDQLGRAHRIDVATVSRERFEDLWIVTVRARTPDGRAREEIGAVPIKGKTGEDLANALMKASTKATRRAILGLVGLGWLDREPGEGEPVVADRHHNIGERAPSAGLTLPPPTQAELDALATDGPPQPNARPVIPDEPPVEGEFVEEDPAAIADALAQDAAFEALGREAPAPSSGPRWAGTPLGKQVSEVADQLTEAGKRFSLPADDATDADLEGWLASKRAVLGQTTKRS